MKKSCVVKMELYKNVNWLRNQYVKEQKSTYKIARLAECKAGIIYRWLRYFNLPIRSRSEAALLNSNCVILSDEAVEFLIGELLGDGHLESTNLLSACYTHGSKHKSYIEWISKRFASFGIGQVGKIKKHLVKLIGREKVYVSFYYASKKYVELKPLHSKWYRKAREDERYKTGKKKRYIKILPLNLELTPLTCLMWYLGDGFFDGRSIRLCTQGFSVSEVDFLRDLLSKLSFETTRFKDKTIHILTRSTKDFLNYVGPCPIPIENIYGYKWTKELSK